MLIPADVVAQRRYVRNARVKHPSSSLGIGPTILRGLRDLGYRDSASALCAVIDNAIDAQARMIDVVLAVRDNRVTAVAVIDTGLGMVPEMMRAACAVGATCALGDGPHLGRSGFGLPSAPFALGRRFQLFSRPEGAALHQLAFDLDALSETDALVPEPVRAGDLPHFVADHIARKLPYWTRGTIVIIDALDRLAPVAPAALRSDLRGKIGFIFGRFLANLTIRLDGDPIAPVDPLFLTPGARGYGEAGERAEVSGTFVIDTGDAEVAIRTALLPPGTAAVSRRQPVTASQADRAAIVRDTNGLIVSRLGRRLTVLTDTPLFHFQTGDRVIRAELDFPPELDDLFAPSLSLQQVHPASELWASLRTQGVAQHLESLRQRAVQQRRRPWVPDAPAVVLRPASPRRRNRCQK